jgi:hypothetical protein
VPIILPAPQRITDDGGKPRLAYSKETQAQIDDVEARIKGVMLRLGAKPGTQNIDRILRLPGTTNLPNEKKRREGRAPCSTLLIEFNNTSHPLSAFPLDEDLSGLPNGLRAQMLLHPEIMRRWRGDKTRLKDQSRSAMDMSLGALLRPGVSASTTCARSCPASNMDRGHNSNTGISNEYGSEPIQQVRPGPNS